jgi:hypothetical protein
MVGERGFEPPTPWSRTKTEVSILLIRLGRLCVILGPFTRFSAVNGPKLDSNFDSLFLDLTTFCLEAIRGQMRAGACPTAARDQRRIGSGPRFASSSRIFSKAL